MKKFNNKVVVISGVGSGIGRALAIEFHQKGARLAINDCNETTLLETVEMIGVSDSILYRSFDVADKDAFYNFADEVVAHFGQVDVVINNAGVAISKLSALEINWGLRMDHGD